MIKKLVILVAGLTSIYGVNSCYTPFDINNSNKLFTYKDSVYDVTGYKHPGGQGDMKKLVGNDLSTFVNSNKLSFHLKSGNQFFDDMKKLYVGKVCNPTTSSTKELTSSTKESTSSTKKSTLSTESPTTSSTKKSTLSTEDPTTLSTKESTLSTESPTTSSTHSHETTTFEDNPIINSSSYMFPTITTIFLQLFLAMIT